MNPLLDRDMKNFSEPFLSERGERSCLSAAPLKFGRVLVPMDLSRASVRGLRYAARVAQTLGGSIWTIYVQEPAPLAGGMESVITAVSDTEAAEGASKLLARFCREAIDASRRGKIVVCIGQPVHEITEAVCSLDIDLIVMTTHGYTGLRHAGYHSIAERVVRRSVCPVLTVHQALLEGKSDEGPGPPLTWKSILVPVDLTESARPVLQYAAALAENSRGSITLFYEAGTRWANGSRATRELRLTHDEIRFLAERLVGVMAHMETSRTEAFEKSVEIAHPNSEAIVQAARRLSSDLIVMGKHDCSW
jgi:universal stress protein A